MSIKPEKTVESSTVYDGAAITVRRDTVRLGSGGSAMREVVEHAPVVVMVPMDSSGNLILVRQYRKPVERVLLELPAGGVEPHESLEEAVVREMVEETGYRPDSIERLTTIFPSPGISNEVMHLFRVFDLVGEGVATESTDELELLRLSWQEAVRMVRDGEITDAKSVVGVLMLESRSQHNES